MKKRLLTVALAGVMALGALTLTSCAMGSAAQTQDGTASVAAQAASQENTEKTASGEITVYTALEDEQVSAYLEQFNKSYPDIKVNVVRESTGIITAKLIAEKDNPQADAVWGTAASSMMVLDDQNMLEPYAPEGVERILTQFKSEKDIPTWVGIDAWETAIIVNTEEAKKLNLPEITSYEDLLKPEFKGHIVMSNPNSSGTGFLTVSAILQLQGKDTPEQGWDFLSKLDENVSQYVHSGSKPAKMAAAGETPVGISFGYAGLSQKEKGAPVEVIFPAEGSGWDLEANALMKKDEIKDAAKTFLNWAISDEAMNLYKENYPIITTGGDGTYEGYEGDPLEQLIDNDFSWAASNRENVLSTWMEKFDAKSAPAS